MKRNRLFILGIVTVLVALLSLTLVSGTYAKYTSSSATASDTARVAKWDIEFKDASDAVITASIDLFDDTYLGVAPHDAVNTVDSNNGDNVVAPGTSKSYTFKVVNKSEVSANIELDSTATALSGTGASTIPLVWSLTIDGVAQDLNGSAEGTSGSFAELVASMNGGLGYMAPQESAGTTKVFVVTWTWAFDGNDASDTALGTAETLATITATFQFNATQVD